MYSAMLVAAGAIFLAYCMYLIRKMMPLIEWRYLKKYWNVVFFLAFLAFAGYAVYLYKLLLNQEPVSLLSAALFFWPVVLMLAAWASFRLVDGLKGTEVSINVGRHNLESDQTAINNLRNALESKNDEMEKLLADMYALRNIAEKSSKSSSENKRMKRILDELKKELDKSRSAANIALKEKPVE